jgi:hypothetical protein
MLIYSTLTASMLFQNQDRSIKYHPTTLFQASIFYIRAVAAQVPQVWINGETRLVIISLSLSQDVKQLIVTSGAL